MLREIERPMRLNPCLRESGGKARVGSWCEVAMPVSINSGIGRGEWDMNLR